MIERHLPGSITVDCCWHDGRVYVVRHSPPRLVVESFAPDLSDQREHLSMPMGANAGARICSWAGVLWLAYRDEGDFGHLLRMDLAEVYDLGMVGGQRPFAFGDGFCAWVVPNNPMRSAKVLPLGQHPDSATVQGFSDNIPTGLSHVESGFAISWDSQRQLEPWGINFVRSGPYLIAQGKHDDGLIGEIDTLAGNLLLWRDALMNDQRLSANGDSCAVIAWQPGAPARLGVVSAADLVQEVPEPPVEPIVPVNRALWFGAYAHANDSTFPGNCELQKPFVFVLSKAGEQLATYAAGNPDGDPDAIEAAVAEKKAQHPELPCIAYVPFKMNEGQYVRWPRNADIIGVEAYRKITESLEQFEQRIRAACATHPRVALIPQTYDSNAHNTKELRTLVPIYARALRDFSHIEFSIAFSASTGRPTGYEDHPEIHPLYQELSQSIQTPATGGGGGGPVPDPELNVRITGFDTPVSRSNPKGGNVTWDEDSARPIKRTIFQMEDGSAAIEFEHTIGTGTDGRYIRGLNYKPVVTGSFHGSVTRIDDQGKRGTARFGPVEVTEDGGGGGPLPPGLIAPNAQWAVQQAMDEHPEIDTTDENERGRILDYACVITGDARWGRKARNQDGSNKNTDGMCFLRSDGKHEIYDAISGHDGSATWDGFGPFDPGENGWWAPHEPV